VSLLSVGILPFLSLHSGKEKRGVEEGEMDGRRTQRPSSSPRLCWKRKKKEGREGESLWPGRPPRLPPFLNEKKSLGSRSPRPFWLYDIEARKKKKKGGGGERGGVDQWFPHAGWLFVSGARAKKKKGKGGRGKGGEVTGLGSDLPVCLGGEGKGRKKRKKKEGGRDVGAELCPVIFH